MTAARVLAPVLIWIMFSLALWATGSNPAVLVLGGIVGVGAVALFGALDFGRVAVPVRWPSRRVPREDDPRVARLRSDARAAVRAGSTSIPDTLLDLVDHRLLEHHQIDRTVTPEAAMIVLTPRLRRFVSAPHSGSHGVRQLRMLLVDIEAL